MTKTVSRNNEKFRHVLLTLGIIFNILILLIFKYYNFFIISANELFDQHIPTIKLLVPLGISFYTFQQISFIVDCYKRTNVDIPLLDYILFVSFFPRYTQGPIVEYSDFTKQTSNEILQKGVDYELMSRGLFRFIIGLSKKVLIADNIALIVDGGYSGIGSLNSLSAIVIIFAYSLQIYFDFSGYSDMAIGIANLFNIKLPENFDSPYSARSISEFWDRWHISLTSFFRRYVYIPLGGNRRGNYRTYLNIMIIFFLSGLWHGADWSFVVWGMLHGMALIVDRLLGDRIQTIPVVIRRISTYLFVSFAWVFFRADNIEQALKLLKRLKYWDGFYVSQIVREEFESLVEWTILKRLDILRIDNMVPGIIAILVIIALSIMCMITNNSKYMSENINTSKIAVIIATAIAVLSVISFTGTNNYIYWNF